MTSQSIELLKSVLISRLLQIENINWQSVELTFIFRPALTRSCKGAHKFKDKQEQTLNLSFPFHESFSGLLFEIIKEFKRTGKENQITFSANKVNLSESSIKVLYNDNIEEEYWRTVSAKGKRKKLMSWWESEFAEEQGLPVPNFESVPSDTLTMYKALCEKLPSSEPALKDPEAMRRDELYHSLASYASDKQNPLWDFSVFVMKKDSSGNFSAELYANYAESAEDLANGYSTTEQGPINNVTDRMKSIYHALQEKTQPLQWDMIAISVSNSGSVEANFEWNDEEVFLEE